MDKQEKQEKQEILALMYLRNPDTVYRVCRLYMKNIYDITELWAIKKQCPLKISDGSLKNIMYSDVDSNAVNDIDKNTLVNDMDWIMASWNIYSDKPTAVTLQLADIVDYTDVEAIIFCGKEFPITEKDF